MQVGHLEWFRVLPWGRLLPSYKCRRRGILCLGPFTDGTIIALDGSWQIISGGIVTRAELVEFYGVGGEEIVSFLESL